jgi:hypothetical protein
VLERFFGGPIDVRRLAAAPAAPTLAQRNRLALDAATPWAHRRVQLVSAKTVLSEADLWFVPSRLAPDMVQALARTDTPFGRIVSPLNPRRTTIAAMLCTPPSAVGLEHRALLVAQAGPIAEVYERYPASLAARARVG